MKPTNNFYQKYVNSNRCFGCSTLPVLACIPRWANLFFLLWHFNRSTDLSVVVFSLSFSLHLFHSRLHVFPIDKVRFLIETHTYVPFKWMKIIQRNACVRETQSRSLKNSLRLSVCTHLCLYVNTARYTAHLQHQPNKQMYWPTSCSLKFASSSRNSI